MDDREIIELYFDRNEQAIRETDEKYGKLCHRIARNLSLKRLEFRTREKRFAEVVLSLEELAEVLPDDRYAPGAEDSEVGKLISIFLRGQKESVRIIFVRKYFYFDSIQEIARRCSFTESKVKNVLFRTRSKLKDYLIKEGVAL